MINLLMVLDEVLYKKGKPRIVNFTTEPDPTEQATKETEFEFNCIQVFLI